MNILLQLVMARDIATNKRLPTLPDLPNIKTIYPDLPNQTANYVVSFFIRAVAIENKRSNYPIVIYVDTQNENILGIFYEKSDIAIRRGIPRGGWNGEVFSGLVPIEKLLERVSNGILPNLSRRATNELVEAIVKYGQNEVAAVSIQIVDRIFNTEETYRDGRNSIEFHHPRYSDDIMGILRDLFKRYHVTEDIPADLFHSNDKTWVYKGYSKDLPFAYLEVELRQAQRAVDKGFEFRVIDPGFKRRIIDASAIEWNTRPRIG